MRAFPASYISDMENNVTQGEKEMAKTKYVDLVGLQVLKDCIEEKISDGFEVVTPEEISGLFTE